MNKIWAIVGHRTSAASVYEQKWATVGHRARAASVYEQNMGDSWP